MKQLLDATMALQQVYAIQRETNAAFQQATIVQRETNALQQQQLQAERSYKCPVYCIERCTGGSEATSGQGNFQNLR